MADYVITAANVLASPTATILKGLADTTITAGQVLAVNTNGRLALAKANGASPLNVVAGIALHSSVVGQPIAYVTQDPTFTLGAAVVAGATVICSGAVAGNMCPDADKVSGWYVTELGHGISVTQIRLVLVPAGVPV